jgi:hypothetical protein
MYRGSDSVFRLSLVGIAFILMFFLLIVFGKMYHDARAGVQDNKTEGDNGNTPVNTQTERALKQQVQELRAQVKLLTQADKSSVLSGTKGETILSALELRARLEQKLSPEGTALSDSDIASQALGAIDFKRGAFARLESELGLSLTPGQESSLTHWVAETQLKPAMQATQANDTRTASNTEILRAQINLMRARLAAQGDTFKLPCWFDEAGRVQFLLNIDLQRNGKVVVTQAWPPARNTDARAISGLDKLLTKGDAVPYNTFTANARELAKRNEQCHYSVQVKDQLRNGKRSEEVHQEIETFFHLPR